MKTNKKDIKIMINEGKFLDIYNKYGKREYKKRIPGIIYEDTLNETNSTFLALCQETKYLITKQLAVKFLRTMLISTVASSVLILGVSEKMVEDNRIKYEQEIDKYDNHIEKYAKEIQQLGLNDFETIIKVMYDEWNYIDGYGPAEMDEMGYYRLAFTEPNQAGVCRNIADDVTAKLNAINPEFDAKNLIVRMKDGEWQLSDIQIRLATNFNLEENTTSNNSELRQEIWGNHLITVVKLPETDILLTIDSTNPSIGILKNGKIHTFSTPDGKGINEPILGNMMYGISHYINTLGMNFDSFFSNIESIAKLKTEYGLEQQNKTLEKIKKL